MPTANLRETLLCDTLTRTAELEVESLQPVFNNLHTYVEVVYHRGYDSDLMQCESTAIRRLIHHDYGFIQFAVVGLCLQKTAGRMADLPDNFDPTSMFMLPTILIQFNKAQSRVCNPSLSSVRTFFDVILTIGITALRGYRLEGSPCPVAYSFEDIIAPAPGHI
jgi:hypothetical protein